MSTPERKAEIKAALDKILGPDPIPKPKVVTREDVGAIRDADVPVSRADKNWPSRDDEGFVVVRRPEYVTIDIPAWERQQEEKRRYKQYLRELDPFRLGHWGPISDDEE
jgi:hypothetical protein